MKHLAKLLTAAVIILTTLALTGCGNSDNFSGKWIEYDSAGGVKRLTIEKNDKKYIVKQIDFYYQESRASGGGTPGVPIINVLYTWKQNSPVKFTAAVKDGRLIIDGSLGSEVITYVEKDKTLLFHQLTYKKEDKNDMETYKKKEQERLTTNTKKDFDPELIKQHLLLPGKLGKLEFKDSATK